MGLHELRPQPIIPLKSRRIFRRTTSGERSAVDPIAIAATRRQSGELDCAVYNRRDEIRLFDPHPPSPERA